MVFGFGYFSLISPISFLMFVLVKPSFTKIEAWCLGVLPRQRPTVITWPFLLLGLDPLSPHPFQSAQKLPNSCLPVYQLTTGRGRAVLLFHFIKQSGALYYKSHPSYFCSTQNPESQISLTKTFIIVISKWRQTPRRNSATPTAQKQIIFFNIMQ